MSPGRDDTTTAIPRAGLRPSLGAVIRVLNAPAAPAEYLLSGGSCRLGAGSSADVVIGDEAMSRVHATFTLVPEGVALEDLGSRNGTFYLGQRVEKIVLALGSRITLGRVEIAIDPDRASLEAVSQSDLTSYGDLIGASATMRKLFSVLVRLEGSLANLLVEGESGTGKELVARAVHHNSTVSDGPFVAINCGAMDRNLARSELFGHKQGAFTGASHSRPGAFEDAHGGTLLLDEVGELPVDIQPVLLRTLETGAVVRVGETRERPVKVRIIAATNRDLQQAVQAGRFREDLFYRLNVVRVRLPPLRERPEDIELLARRFAEPVGIAELPGELLADLRQRSWPGNVRELKNALHAFAALGMLAGASSPPPDELESALRRMIDVAQPYARQKEQFLHHFVHTYLVVLLEHTGGNQSEAARISGLERSHLNKILAKLGLSRG
jgi:DNA-binding NtrC family response regulator